MILGTGVDIVQILRFTDIDSKPHLMNKLFTINEQEYLKIKKAQSAAGLFAGKEAVVKAMGCGFKNFYPNAVEILHTSLGKPYVKLHGNAEALLKKEWAIHISISHSQTDAIAFAVIEASI